MERVSDFVNTVKQTAQYSSSGIVCLCSVRSLYVPVVFHHHDRASFLRMGCLKHFIHLSIKNCLNLLGYKVSRQMLTHIENAQSIPETGSINYTGDIHSKHYDPLLFLMLHSYSPSLPSSLLPW